MLKTIIDQALTPLLATLAAALATLIAKEVVVALRWISKKTGLQFTVGQEAAAQDATKRVALYVEEWAAKQIIKPTAEAKLEQATKLLLTKCPWLAGPEVDVLIHSTLAALGLGAVGAQRQTALRSSFDKAVQAKVDAVTPPSPAKQGGFAHPRVLLAIAVCALVGLVAAVAFAGCTGAQKTAFGNGVQTCEANSLPQLAQGPLLQVGIALYSAGSNWKQELQNVGPALAGTVLAGQIDCLVKAWQLALAAKPAPSPVVLATASVSASANALALAHANEWLATHHSCTMPSKSLRQLRAAAECGLQPLGVMESRR